MSQMLSALIEALRDARHFEDAAEAALRAMLERATASLAVSKRSKKGKLLRATAHVRPADGYKRLIAVEATSQLPPQPDAYLPSTSAWRWVAEHKRPVAMDVHVGTI